MINNKQQYCFLIIPLLLTCFNVNAQANCELNSTLSGNVILEKQCTYNGGITINQSGTTLDCNGAKIYADNSKDGITISSEGKVLEGVVIRNCNIYNARESGIRVSWLGPDTRKSGQPERYLRTPHNILLQNNVIENSGKNGIFLDDYTSNVTVINSRIKNSKATAIYLEHDSERNNVIGNIFTHNGYSNGRARREAIAIDSSQKNTIKNNIFSDNGLGGIFIYKNCSEHFSSGTQEMRKMHANYNILEGNTFENQKIGIWLASRKYKNLKRMDCGDQSIDGKGDYYPDYADNNRVSLNTFKNVERPIINDGNNNIIENNKIKNDW